LLIIGILVTAEFSFFCYVLAKDTSIQKTDAIIVFNGARERIEAGYELAGNGYAPYLVISPSTRKTLKADDQKYLLPPDVIHLKEEKARTTFENALLTHDIIKAHHFKKIHLVTSAYHMPRSFLLLKLLLNGSDTEIYTFRVKDDPSDVRQYLIRNKKILYNEMIEVWGSLFEAVAYAVHGKLPEQSLHEHKTVAFLKAALLFSKPFGS